MDTKLEPERGSEKVYRQQTSPLGVTDGSCIWMWGYHKWSSSAEARWKLKADECLHTAEEPNEFLRVTFDGRLTSASHMDPHHREGIETPNHPEGTERNNLGLANGESDKILPSICEVDVWIYRSAAKMSWICKPNREKLERVNRKAIPNLPTFPFNVLQGYSLKVISGKEVRKPQGNAGREDRALSPEMSVHMARECAVP